MVADISPLPQTETKYGEVAYIWNSFAEWKLPEKFYSVERYPGKTTWRDQGENSEQVSSQKEEKLAELRILSCICQSTNYARQWFSAAIREGFFPNAASFQSSWGLWWVLHVLFQAHCAIVPNSILSQGQDVIKHGSIFFPIFLLTLFNM